MSSNEYFQILSLKDSESHCVKSVKMRIISDPHFPVFRPEMTPYLGTFHADQGCIIRFKNSKWF